MDNVTPLDQAYASMSDNPGDDGIQLKYFERFLESELFVLLTAEVNGDQASPTLLNDGGHDYLLAFDTEERLSKFAEDTAPYTAMTGRTLLGVLTGQDSLGVALNQGVGHSDILLDVETVNWLTDLAEQTPEMHEKRIVALNVPAHLPDAFVTSLEQKLPTMAGLATHAYLARAEYSDGSRGHILGFAGTQIGAESALAQAVSEALIFSGLEDEEVDVGFLQDDHPLTASFRSVGLAIELPKVESSATPPGAPGLDPDRPPKLR